MSDLKPNRSPKLKHLLSDRLIAHLDSQLPPHQRINPEARDRTPDHQPKKTKQRFSVTVACTLSLPLRQHFVGYAHTHNIPLGELARAALAAFLSNPPQRPHLPITPHTKFLKRSAVLTFAINPRTTPNLREYMDAYAERHGLTVSAVLRRALYEYIQKTHPNPNPDLLIDAWGDVPKANASTPQLPSPP